MRPAGEQTPGLLSPHVNAQEGQVSLEQFSWELEPEVHGVLFWDRAAYHCAKHPQVADNVTIVPLTPYSPDPNAVENLWRYLPTHRWSNRRLIAGTTR